MMMFDWKIPIPDRHLCISEMSHPNYQYSYPCPYRLDLPQYSPEDTAVPYYELMDLSDISSDIPDVMNTMSDKDIPYLDAIFQTLNMDYGLHKLFLQ